MKRLSRIEERFRELRNEKRAAVIPYLTAGFPSLETSERIFRALAEAGSDIIEVGIPFSDPLADGPTIQRSSQIALSQGVTTRDVLDMIGRLRETLDTPLVVMTYYNLFYRYGLEKFAADAERAGVDGVIIPDLPPEEAGDWLKTASGKLDTIFLLAPTSTDDRIEKVALATRGFIYCVSLTGITGARDELSLVLPDFIWRVRSKTDKPLAVGFGISTPEQAKEVAEVADGVIIGSALINVINRGKTQKEQVDKAKGFVEEIRRALRS